jgi:hypothetical protein
MITEEEVYSGLPVYCVNGNLMNRNEPFVTHISVGKNNTPTFIRMGSLFSSSSSFFFAQLVQRQCFTSNYITCMRNAV